jgi:RimJ/RimL family protein N-acetyltransferase
MRSRPYRRRSLTPARAFGLQRVVAVVAQGNKGSIRVLEKAGMNFERMHAMEANEPEVCLYACDLSDA